MVMTVVLIVVLPYIYRYTYGFYRSLGFFISLISNTLNSCFSIPIMCLIGTPYIIISWSLIIPTQSITNNISPHELRHENNEDDDVCLPSLGFTARENIFSEPRSGHCTATQLSPFINLPISLSPSFMATQTTHRIVWYTPLQRECAVHTSVGEGRIG